MTGRFSRRIAQVHDVAQSIIDNHPLSEIVDCNETLDSCSNIAATRIDNNPLSWAAKRESHVSTKLNTSHASIIFSECISTGGTGRTLSTDSWCDDDFEKENTKKVRNLLDCIDEVIYERKKLDDLSSEVQDECHLWSRKFPCLRVLGKQIMHSEADGIQFHLPMINLEDRSKVNEITSLHTKDALFPVLPLREAEHELLEPSHSGSSSSLDYEYEHAASTNSTEEIIAQNGQCEELFACHNFDNNRDENCSEDNSSSQKTPLSDLNVDAIRECVINKLMESLWPEMLSLWQLMKDEGNNDDKAVSAHKKTLPSLSTSKPDVKRTQEYGGSYHPLDGILTISSKVLQKRDHRFSAESGVVTRPGSNITSPQRTVSYHSSISVQEPSFFRTPLQHGGPNFPSVPNSRVSSAVRRLNRYVSRDVEWSEALQCLQEESENLSNIEQPLIHIQQSFCDENTDLRFPTSHFSLPPIIDANTVLTKQNIRSPISPTSVENPLLDKRLNNRLARNEEIDSRPSTCISTRSVMGQNNKNFKNPELPSTQDSPSIQILGGLSSKLLSPSRQREARSQLPLLGPKLASERLVTLFPIIKSLELQKQNDNKKTLTKRNQSAKRLGHYNSLNQSKR